jgi:hypothetical protein
MALLPAGLLAIGLDSRTPVSGAQRSYSALLRVLRLTRPGEQRVAPAPRDAWVGFARPHVTEPGGGRRAAKAQVGSLIVEAEAVGDGGRLAATGDPELGQDS